MYKNNLHKDLSNIINDESIYHQKQRYTIEDHGSLNYIKMYNWNIERWNDLSD